MSPTCMSRLPVPKANTGMRQHEGSPMSRFRRPTLLIVGCGDIGLRVVRLLRGRFRLLALTSTRERFAELRDAGAVPVFGDLDDATSLTRLSSVADRVLHLAPPPSSGAIDTRTAHLLQALALGG